MARQHSRPALPMLMLLVLGCCAAQVVGQGPNGTAGPGSAAEADSAPVPAPDTTISPRQTAAPDQTEDPEPVPVAVEVEVDWEQVLTGMQIFSQSMDERNAFVQASDLRADGTYVLTRNGTTCDPTSGTEIRYQLRWTGEWQIANNSALVLEPYTCSAQPSMTLGSFCQDTAQWPAGPMSLSTVPGNDDLSAVLLDGSLIYRVAPLETGHVLPALPSRCANPEGRSVTILPDNTIVVVDVLPDQSKVIEVSAQGSQSSITAPAEGSGGSLVINGGSVSSSASSGSGDATRISVNGNDYYVVNNGSVLTSDQLFPPTLSPSELDDGRPEGKRLLSDRVTFQAIVPEGLQQGAVLTMCTNGQYLLSNSVQDGSGSSLNQVESGFWQRSNTTVLLDTSSCSTASSGSLALQVPDCITGVKEWDVEGDGDGEYRSMDLASGAQAVWEVTADLADSCFF